MKKIYKFLKLIWEGKSISDKVLISFYLIKNSFTKNLKINNKLRIKNKYGEYICGETFDEVWIASSFHEPHVYKELIKKEFDIFIDVGANIGKYSIILGKKLKDNGQVISIEPEPRNFEILNKNIKLNNLKNVTAINNGLYSKKGKLDFYLTSEKSGDGAHSLIKKTNNKIQIKVDTLDNIIKEKGLKDIKLIKIDVEGAEANVLKGAKKTLKKYHPKLIFEAWDETYFKKIKNILDKYNYKFEKIGSQNYFAF